MLHRGSAEVIEGGEPLNDHNAASDLAPARERMLALVRHHLRDARVVAAVAAVPRERFVPEHMHARAYDDCALPIGEGQTISQPLMVALMTEALMLQTGDLVLEVGTGCGYQAAVLSQIAGEVLTVERVPALRERARLLLGTLGYANVFVYAAGDMLGLPERGPYDAIIVTAGAPRVPRDLIGQLKPGGRLVVPTGALRAQELVRVVTTPHGTELTRLGPCAFVPLIGRGAWSPADLLHASRSAKV